jgi:hypothetical protein
MVLLFNGTLGAGFKPSSWLQIAAEEITLAFHLVTSGGPTTINWFLEFTDDPTGTPIASREVDEQDTGNGVVTMSKVLRTFKENGGAALADGVHDLSTQFTRQTPYVRLQIQVTAGVAAAKITSSTGSLPVNP